MTVGMQMLVGSGGPSFPAMTSVINAGGFGGSPAQFVMDSDGHVYWGVGTPADHGSWVIPNARASEYEFRTVVTSGSFSSDPSAGSFVSLGTDRSWTRNAGIGTTQTVTATYTLRHIASGATVATGTLNLTCDNS